MNTLSQIKTPKEACQWEIVSRRFGMLSSFERPSLHEAVRQGGLLRHILITFIFLFTVTLLPAATLNVPSEYITIQSAINASTDGDTVLVQPGIYVENINYIGKNIVVGSLFLTTQDTSYISSTIIDGNQNGSVVTFNGGETSATVLSGFTIQNGSAVSGGGIYCNYSSPTLTNLTLSGNTSWAGGGIYFMGLSPNLVNVTISGNTASFEGGGIYCQNSNLSLENVTISGNWSDNRGGGIFCHNSSLVLENVTISGNVAPYGGGIYFSGPSLSLINVTISGNTADYGGGFYCGSSSIDLINTIAWNNSPQEIYFAADGDANTATITYSDVQGGETGIVTNDNATVTWGNGNIDVDPLFVDGANGDYHLSDYSPAIGAGADSVEIGGTFYYSPDTDIDGNPRPWPAGSNPDMGAYENPLAHPIDITAPAPPQNLTATPGNQQVTLRWNANPELDLHKYNIYRDITSPAITLIDSVVAASPPDTFYVDTGLTNGQIYYYRITAVDSGGNESGFSDEVSATPIYILEQDSLALVSLYNNTDGANWTNNTNWLTGNVSTWYGITVSEGRVTQIHLGSNNLIGTIPPEIGNLDSLQYLDLWDNQLSGSIPSSIGNLTKLNTLELSTNQFSGSIPSEIGNLTNLSGIYLQYNQLTGSIPSEIGNLTNLTSLGLYSNQLTGSIPTEIGNLTNSTYLHLHTNQLTGSIPPEIGNLTNLTSLGLQGNQLSGSIPPEIGNLTNLQYLDFGDNQLTGLIPTEIGNLTSLILLHLHHNQLTGSIPPEIGNLTNLTELYLSTNKYSGSIPPEIGDLTNLQVLWLNDNEFTDLPNLSPIDSLKNLKIENNRFTFEDIEPNIGVPDSVFTYSPQDSVGVEQDTTVNTGSSLTVSVSVGGANNQYQWKKDGTNIGTQSSDSSYTIDPMDFNDAGAYNCEITNTVASELTLYSRPINVTVEYSLLQLDSLALVALYDSTNGANWTNNTNWLTGPVSTWYGITVTNWRVTGLSLGNNNLVGTIPPEIGNLDSLQYLDLWDNQLSGSIPSSIVNLTNLKELELFNNQLTGSIPDEIGNLLNLNTLLLDRNQLSGSIPSIIGNLTELNRLHIGNNQLTGSIPPELGNLTNLTEDFVFGGNNLSGEIPPELGYLTSLQVLDLSNNQLTGSIPHEIGNLTNLQYLWLNENQLTGSIPSEIGYITMLDWLNLGGNQITGSIPPEIGNLMNLTDLNLSGNQLSGTIPVELGNLTNLTHLSLPDNQLTGTIPVELSNLTNLTLLHLQYNQLTGSIPSEIGNLTNLTELGLFLNQLTGSISTEIGNLILLRYLNVWGNQLTGSIPVEIGNLTNLEFLDFGANQFTGSIPTEIGNFTNLATLRLSDNQLTGTIPAEIGNLTSLTHLHLNNNQLGGSIPPDIGNLTNLSHLSFRDNQLIGTIPTEIGNVTNLTNLDFAYNQLSGSIPAEIGSLTNLEGLWLHNNQLSGSIPPEIGNLTNLTELYLFGNQLTGSIPSEVGNLTNLQILGLTDNQLSGVIPTEIGNLTNLAGLDFRMNQLSGIITQEINNLTNLQYFHLDDNEFTDLPDLSPINSLKDLKIENNKFTFEDIEPNIGVPDSVFTYSPQDSVGTEQDTTVTPGSSLTVSVTVGGTNNQYQWYKDEAQIPGATDSSYTIDPVDFADAGAYTCEITNTIATELTLYRRLINVTVIDTIAPTVPQNLTATPGDHQVTLNWLPNTESDLSHYIIYRSQDAVNFQQLAIVEAPIATYIDFTLNLSIPNYYQIVAVDTMGLVSDDSEILEVSFPIIFSSSDLVEFSTVIADNPEARVLTLYNGGSDTLEIDNMFITGEDSVSFSIDITLGNQVAAVGTNRSWSNPLHSQKLNGTNIEFIGLSPTVHQKTGSVLTSFRGYIDILPGDSLALTVTCAPADTGYLSASLAIFSNDPIVQPKTVELTGTGIAPLLTFSSDIVDFGSIFVDSTVFRSMMFRNTGGAPLEVSTITSSDQAHYSVTPGAIPLIMSGDSAQIIITFTPSALDTFPAKVTINSNDLFNPVQIIELHGVGSPHNYLPSVVVFPLEQEEFDTVLIYYSLSDADDDILSLTFQYLSDDSTTWIDAKILEVDELTVIEPPNYSGVAHWISQFDFPEQEASQVLLRSIVTDIYGSSETIITVHIDNYHGELIIDPLDGEYAGDVDIHYTLTDPWGDVFSITPQYFDPIPEEWTDATVTGELVGIGPENYSGNIAWLTLEDLPSNEDPILFRIKPHDGLQFGMGDTIPIAVDNVAPPQLVEYEPTISNVTSWTGVEIPMSFNSEIDESTIEFGFTIEGEISGIHDFDFSYNTETKTVVLFPETIFAGAETVTVTISTLLTDTFSIPFDGNGNGDLDPDEDSFSWQFVTTLLGDYTTNGIVNYIDLADFREAWVDTQLQIVRDIGPTIGEVPKLLPTRDSLFNFEDLMVFARMWNWSYENEDYSDSTQILAKIEGTDNPVGLTLNFSDKNIWLPEKDQEISIAVRFDSLSSFTVFGMEYQYNPEVLYFKQYESIIEEPWSLLSFSNHEKGKIVIAGALLGKSSPEITPGNAIILNFSKLLDTDTEIDYSVSVWDTDDKNKTYPVNKFIFSTETPLPDKFVLHQNFPNPFNPATTIRYEIPADVHVNILIYNILGQKVLTLVNHMKEAGYHQIVWNGKDQSGRSVSTGIYFLYFHTAGFSSNRKIILIK